MALQDIVTKGSTDRSVAVKIVDSTDGTPETGVVWNTAGVDLWYRREGAAVTSITEVTLAALTTAHADGGFLAIGNGDYRLDLPDAAFATGAQHVDFGGTVTGMVVIGGRVRLVDFDLEVALATASALATVDANVDAILVDTGTTIPATIATVDTVVDSILVDTAEIGVAGAGLTALATAAALTTVDTVVDSILVDTAVIGALGAGLTALASQASVDALNDVTAAAVAVATWDAVQSSHVGAGTFGEIATETAAILVDTNELQADDVPTLIATLDAVVDTVKADTAAILVDTAVIGSGGAGLTALATAAALATVDANVDAILVDTAEIGVAGAGLTALATAAQVSNIGAATGGALNFPATSDNAGGAIDPATTVKVGTPTATYTSTYAADGSYHVIADAANVIDWVYGFAIGGNRSSSSLAIRGFANAQNDDLTISAYDFVGSAWETIGTLTGAATTNNITTTIPLLSKHTGTGSEIGNVYIRFNGSGLTASADLNIDQIFVGAVSNVRSVGYDQGAVHVDTLAGVAGVEAFVNGVADNPVDTWAQAETIAAAVGISHYHIANGSSVTLNAATNNAEISGDEYTIALGGYSIDNTSISNGLSVTGTFLGYPHILETGIGAAGITGPGAKIGMSALRGPVVSNAATNTWVLHDCWAATGAEFDFGAAVAAAQTVFITNYAGPITIKNMDHASDVLHLSGKVDLTIDASCTAGTINMVGAMRVTNNGSGQTLNLDDVTTDVNAVLVDTNELQTDDTPAAIAALNNITAAAVVDAFQTRGATAQAGAAGTITLDASASAANDFYNGQIIVLESGTGAGQARQVSSYVGATKVATVDTNWVTNPDVTTVFRILGYLVSGSGASAASIADAVLDEALSGHTTAGTLGKAIADTEVDAATAAAGGGGGGGGGGTNNYEV
jgi:hypothetical protein